MFPHDNTVRNNMTIAECRRYLTFLSEISNRELIKSIIDGTNPTWVLADMGAGRILEQIYNKQPYGTTMVHSIYSRTLLLVIRRTKNNPVKPKVEPEPTPQVVLDVIDHLKAFLGGQGKLVSFNIKITTDQNEVLTLKQPNIKYGD